MIKLLTSLNKKSGIIVGLFGILFLYFGLFNRYHILYLEQNQLFLYSWDYLGKNFQLPGGLPQYLGSFFTQFFISSYIGAIIISLSGITVFILTDQIQKQHGLNSIILALVPVWLIVILQSNELFSFNQTIGFLSLLSFIAIYVSISKPLIRKIFFLSGWPVFYLLSGGFSIPAVLFCAIHEIFFRKDINRMLYPALYIIEGLLIPLISSWLLFYIPAGEVYNYSILPDLHSYPRVALMLLFAWMPVLIFAIWVHSIFPSYLSELKGAKVAGKLAGSFIVLLMALAVYLFGYNSTTERMLAIDHYVQQEEWEKVPGVSDSFRNSNRLVICYTDLALQKTGKLLDKMFCYPQTGSDGLRLKWERNASLFFGGEVFYQLSYTSEASRWAFEAMIAKGLNPRSLKRLVITSLINGDEEIARKYLYILHQTLFYRKFTAHYVDYLTDPLRAGKYPAIERSRQLTIHNDFVSNANDLNLIDLLSNHPENKMAFEYLIASLLLDKKLDTFARIILNAGSYGYARLPIHVEEALICYNSLSGKHIVPPGYSLSPELDRRYNEFKSELNSAKNNFMNRPEELRTKYGHTYWYYLQFTDNRQK